MPGYDLFPIRGLVGFCLQAFTGPATRAHHQGRTIRIKTFQRRTGGQTTRFVQRHLDAAL